MIQVQNLSYEFPTKELYKNVSFTLEEGQHCAFIGSNGTGKTTLVDMIIDPEKYLYHCYSAQTVKIVPADGITDEKSIMTADLIQNCFELRNTGIRIVGCDARLSRLADTMNKLYTTLGNYKQDTSSKKYYYALRAMLKREYKFAAFTRHYVRTHLQDYPELSDLVS